MTMYVHWTCININRKDVHASMISINGKEMNKEYGCIAQFWKQNETSTIFFLKKPSLVIISDK